MNQQSPISSTAIGLTGLSVEFCKIVAAAPAGEPADFIREVIRYLPRIYIALCDLEPYPEQEMENWEDYDNGTIGEHVTEEQYDMVWKDLAMMLGEYDSYLDIPVEEMRYQDTPVAVSLSEQICDIFQQLANFAATMSAIDIEDTPDVLADLKFRFHEFLSDTICAALRAANMIYQANVLVEK